MFLITCPVTGTDELVSLTGIRSVTNHPTHIALRVQCPACGEIHEHRTGRAWEAAQRSTAAQAKELVLA
jgi:hypothetical protein